MSVDREHLRPLLVYCRQSRAKTGETRESSLSLEQQRDAILEWAPRNGYRVEQIVTDHDETGRSLSRPGIAELKERARPGLTIAVWKYDRFARNLIGQELVVEDLRSLGVEVVSTTEPPGKLPRQLMGSIAEYYSDQLSERMAAVRGAEARRGQYTGGPPPFGYRRRDEETVIGKDGQPRIRRVGPIVPHPDEAPVVQEIFARFVAGESMYAIGVSLMERRIPRCGPMRGRPKQISDEWHPSNLARMLTNPFYAGKIRHKGVIVAIGQHEPLVDLAVWEEAQRIKERAATLRRRSPNDLWSWLEGRVTHVCGSRMHLTPIRGKTRRDGTYLIYPSFVCKRSSGFDRCGIPRVVIAQGKLERMVRACLIQDLAGAWSLDAAVARAEQLAGGHDAEQRRRAIADRRRIVEHRFAKARELYLENDDDIATWREEKARHQAKIAELDAELAALPIAPDPARYRVAATLLAQTAQLLDRASDDALARILDPLGTVEVSPSGVTIRYRAPYADFITAPTVIGS